MPLSYLISREAYSSKFFSAGIQGNARKCSDAGRIWKTWKKEENAVYV